MVFFNFLDGNTSSGEHMDEVAAYQNNLDFSDENNKIIIQGLLDC